MMLLTGAVTTDGHVGYVAGRYRSGVWSDQWTDVSRCAERTFTDYAPACACGWRGSPRSATADGHVLCQGAWGLEHRIDPTAAATNPGPSALPR
jgi:hypothetical protein